jgi:SHS2 domain-containing protein
MGYRWVEHTGEVELEIEAPTEEAGFSDALRALAELLADGPREDRISCEIAVAGEERALLLARWLEELVYRAETENLVPEEVERIELFEHGLHAVVRCRRGTPRHLVKGVTYHRLAFEPGAGGFRARVVLDV